MKKIILILLFALPLSLFANESILRIGMELTYPPFETICPEGPCGISVDIANQLGIFLNRKIVIENIPFVGLIPSLKNGKIDLIISSMSITPERSRSIQFSKPYISLGLCLLANAKSPLNSIEEANSPQYKIVVKAGTSGELYASQHLKRAIVHVLDKESMCVLEVVQGKSDAFIYDQLSVYRNWNKNRTTTKALLTPFQQEQWGIGLRKNETALLEQVNRFLEQFCSSNELEKISEKYLSKEKAAFQELGVPFVF